MLRAAAARLKCPNLIEGVIRRVEKQVWNLVVRLVARKLVAYPIYFFKQPIANRWPMCKPADLTFEAEQIPQLERVSNRAAGCVVVKIDEHPQAATR